ncbi:recombinase family protein [Thalassotalea sp. 1_MG-2023]|uniref:recombinase family protein n=1 Tax=Thalassotalea sp. 1_MG-2023 TaxID=3062680 RepID=UPI0026E2AE87|nr:recombinase family protein [Thalassotalea sp. 1_MG-2023]MDO6428630.1 recombinase family protein [Thalassotalea sp. 1_MG-2023]
MKAKLYLRASTRDQDAQRALRLLTEFCETNSIEISNTYIENFSGTKLSRPQLSKLLEESVDGEILLVESVDRLSRLSQSNWEKLKLMINEKGLRLIVIDLPTTHTLLNTDDLTGSILSIINNMLLDLMATMARLDNDKRIERIHQGLERAKAAGKKLGGSTKNKQYREQVKQYLDKKLKAEDIAKIVGCGTATVYRIRKELGFNST